jgi:tetratricopeptide (TPR) repeat protein
MNESQTSDPEDPIFSTEPNPASSEIIHQSSLSSSIRPASTINVSDVLSIKPNISMVQVAIEKEPLNYWLWHALCTLYAAQNDLDGAIEACKTEIQKSPSNPSPLMELMNLYAANGDYEAAMGCGLGLLNIKPAILRVALTTIRSPLIMSIVSDIESKQNSLEL